MARTGRIESSTGIYHIMVRGVNRQSIFVEKSDYLRYIANLREYQEEIGFELYAYCLMGNHLHLLLKEGNESIGNSMKRLGVSYVSWFNWQYDRSGHLFQGRFKSEPVENEEYFLTVLRYIHQNPIKAGLVKNIEDYTWASYREYINQNNLNNLVNRDYGLEIFSKNKTRSIERFIEFHKELNEDSCLDIEEEKRTLSDKDIKDLVSKEYKIDLTNLHNASEDIQDKILEHLMDKEGVALRQLSRLTGMTVHRIYKMKK